MLLALVSLVGLSLAASPHFFEERLASGNSVVLVDTSDARLSFVQLRFAVGHDDDPIGKSGLIYVTLEVLRLELASRLPGLMVGVNRESLTLSFWQTNEEVAKTAEWILKRIKAIALSPRLDELFTHAIANTRQRRRQIQNQDRGLLELGVLHVLYGRSSAASGKFGTLEDLGAIKLEDVIQRIERLTQTQDSSLTVVGGQARRLGPTLEQHLKAFYTAERLAVSGTPGAVPKRRSSKKRRILIIDRPGAREALAIMFQPEFPTKASSSVADRVARTSVNGLRYGLFGRHISKYGGRMQPPFDQAQDRTENLVRVSLTERSLGVVFRCEPQKLAGILRQLDTFWRKAKIDGLSGGDIEAARRQVLTEVLLDRASSQGLADALNTRQGASWPTPHSMQGQTASIDQNLKREERITAIPDGEINAILMRGLMPEQTQVVIVTDVSGPVLKALAGLPDREAIEVIAYDALL